MKKILISSILISLVALSIYVKKSPKEDLSLNTSWKQTWNASHYQHTKDWFTHQINPLSQQLMPFREKALRVLEIGSFEAGQSHEKDLI